MSGVAEMLKSVFQQMTYEPKINLVNVLHTENANLSCQDCSSTISKLDNLLNIYLISYKTLTSVVKPSSNGHH
jgi:hypothetical protein